MENFEDRLASLEALLFIHGEPLARKKAQKVLEATNEEFDLLLKELAERLSQTDRGLNLMNDGEKIQLVTKPQFGKLLEGFVKAELNEDLTPAGLEVLSIIAYLGPISRSRIEYRRGVNSSFTLRNLLLRGLIEKFSDSQHPASPLYRPSFEFLKYLGIAKQEELPEYPKFSSLLTVPEPNSSD